MTPVHDSDVEARARAINTYNAAADRYDEVEANIVFAVAEKSAS